MSIACSNDQPLFLRDSLQPTATRPANIIYACVTDRHNYQELVDNVGPWEQEATGLKPYPPSRLEATVATVVELLCLCLSGKACFQLLFTKSKPNTINSATATLGFKTKHQTSRAFQYDPFLFEHRISIRHEVDATRASAHSDPLLRV